MRSRLLQRLFIVGPGMGRDGIENGGDVIEGAIRKGNLLRVQIHIGAMGAVSEAATGGDPCGLSPQAQRFKFLFQQVPDFLRIAIRTGLAFTVSIVGAYKRMHFKWRLSHDASFRIRIYRGPYGFSACFLSVTQQLISLKNN